MELLSEETKKNTHQNGMTDTVEMSNDKSIER